MQGNILRGGDTPAVPLPAPPAPCRGLALVAFLLPVVFPSAQHTSLSVRAAEVPLRRWYLALYGS